jgi:uncharacterized protein
MGPSNVALVKLYQADRDWREAEARLESASRTVRVQERRIADLGERLRLSQVKLREQQAAAAQLELDMRVREERIERLRTQQQTAKSHREYQAFLTEINAEKIDKGKVEEQALAAMEVAETIQGEIRDLSAQLDGEQKKHAQTKAELAGRLAELQAEVDRLRPLREQAAAQAPPKGINIFERLVERYEGEAMAAIGKPDRRREEYICSGCNMSLVADVYNRLHTRDDLVQCPSCRRLLYIPDDLPPETAIHKPKERRERTIKGGPAAMTRQVSAADISRSITPESDESDDPGEQGAQQPAGANDPAPAPDSQ